jgi:hypothetical protein
MPVKKTLEEVKNEFKKHNYILLENEYINQSTKMKCICSNGHYIEITYKSVKKYKGGCKKCGYERLSRLHSHDYEYAKQVFEDAGYELLEKVYKNERTKMKYRCKKHPEKEVYISVNCLKRGQRCPYCSMKKVDYDSIKNILDSKGYCFLGSDQVDGQSMIFYSCPRHPEEVLHIRPTDLRRGYGCKFCVFDNRVGDKNHNWKGGVSKLSSFLRYSTYRWKKDILNETKSACLITQEDEEIELHHLIPFHKVRDKVLNNFGYTGYEEINELTKQKLNEMRTAIEEEHRKVRGVPLKKSIHKEFHSLYGHDFEESDFWEFVKEYRRRNNIEILRD